MDQRDAERFESDSRSKMGASTPSYWNHPTGIFQLAFSSWHPLSLQRLGDSFLPKYLVESLKSYVVNVSSIASWSFSVPS